MSVRCHVAVIGAGVIGLAVAVELRRLDVPDVLVIDGNNTPGSGSTCRANGGVRAQFATAINIEFSRFGIAALADLDRASDGLVGLRHVGYLFMTGTEAGATQLERGYELQRSLGVPVEWLSASAVLRIAPYVRPDGLRAGTFCGTDGILDPAGVIAALWNAGRELGVQYLLGEPVTAIDGDGRTGRLRTRDQVVSADHVVNAAGPFARALAAMAGIDLPVQPYRRNLACTEAISSAPTAMPMCVDLDTGVLVRREADGYLLAYSDPDEPSGVDTTFDPSFLAALAARLGNRFPFLERAPIDSRKCWAGLYPQTPDHTAIIDMPLGAPWFVQCAGFGGHGIMHALAAGRAVAELIRDGRCTTFDLAPLRLVRFAEAGLSAETAVL